MMDKELKSSDKLQERITHNARVFGYAIDPKEWKTRTPLYRIAGYKAGAEHEIKNTLILIDRLLNENDSEELKKLRRLILEV